MNVYIEKEDYAVGLVLEWGTSVRLTFDLNAAQCLVGLEWHEGEAESPEGVTHKVRSWVLSLIILNICLTMADPKRSSKS